MRLVGFIIRLLVLATLQLVPERLLLLTRKTPRSVGLCPQQWCPRPKLVLEEILPDGDAWRSFCDTSRSLGLEQKSRVAANEKE